ncbi:PTS sugar transporter subunit IIA [Brachybacterium sacelli]|uniref:PTS system D-glucosamine-specific IIC component/PTS system glucose-specific IIA component n=1 Tax=Brachybacterium sacelli TaxID=173364 RepID=A0ABS4WZF4_9MICO|nr:PTS glucose transporter subunit IIA [Brachybacterium sacelli]MBP2381582.1 PTS system D-glucosamine-specific IIC component/PTS system glucose-specific IIA component [Brachybacterium sacelli]
MFGMHRKKKAATPGDLVAAPVRGRLLPLDQVPDPVFSGGLMGPGFAVDPSDGRITAPVAGTIVMVPETLHAVGLRTAAGTEILIHVGIDTVTLKGEGFTAHCAVGDDVEPGAPLLEVDLETVREHVPSMITPVIVTNAAERAVGEVDLEAAAGAPVLTITGP